MIITEKLNYPHMFVYDTWNNKFITQIDSRDNSEYNTLVTHSEFVFKVAKQN